MQMRVWPDSLGKPYYFVEVPCSSAKHENVMQTQAADQYVAVIKRFRLDDGSTIRRQVVVADHEDVGVMVVGGGASGERKKKKIRRNAG
jgi:hypothetical protein